MRKLLIVGAGGHGKVVADTAAAVGKWSELSFIDNNVSCGTYILDYPVVGKIGDIPRLCGEYSSIVVAIGDNKLRGKLTQEFIDIGFQTPAIIHPTAYISRYAKIEPGTVVFAGAVVNAAAQVGFASIVNTGVTVDHDCIIGRMVHLSPGVNVAGNVVIGDYSWLGIGAVVINNISIGKEVVIGAGAVVIKSIPDKVKAVGVPARIIHQNIGGVFHE